MASNGKSISMIEPWRQPASYSDAIHRAPYSWRAVVWPSRHGRSPTMRPTAPWAHHIESCDVGAAGVAARYQLLEGAPPVRGGAGKDSLRLTRIPAGEHVHTLDYVVDLHKSLAKVATVSTDERSPVFGVEDGRVAGPHDLRQPTAEPTSPVADIAYDPLQAWDGVRHRRRDHDRPVANGPEGTSRTERIGNYGSLKWLAADCRLIKGWSLNHGHPRTSRSKYAAPSSLSAQKKNRSIWSWNIVS